MGLPDVISFDFMNPPSQSALEDALHQLVLLEAVESVETQKVIKLAGEIFLSKSQRSLLEIFFLIISKISSFLSPFIFFLQDY